MTYLFSQYWIFIALAVVLGLFVGWATRGGGPRSAGGWVGWAIAWFLVGLFVALFKWLPGLAGHLLEVALLLFAAFVIGCIAGCGARGATGGDDEGAKAHENAHGNAHGAAAAQSGAATAAHTHQDVIGVDSSASYPGARPAAAIPGSKADDLTVIDGIDPGTAKSLGDIGVRQYGQIGGWGAPQAAWVEHHLAQPGRIGRENWIEQAKNLASGKAPGIAAAAAAAGGIAAAASGAIHSATTPAATAKAEAAPAKADGGETAGSSVAASGASAAADAKANAPATRDGASGGAATGATDSGASAAAHTSAPASEPGAGDATSAAARASAPPSGASTGAAVSAASAEASHATKPESAQAATPAAQNGSSAQTAGAGAVSGAPSANQGAAGAAPAPGMTDGQRSILAAREKMAMQARKGAALAAAAVAGGAAAHASAEAAPVSAPATARPLTIEPRAGMTDGQRSILAAKQRMAEKAARVADAGATATGAGAAAPAMAATAVEKQGGGPIEQGAGDGRPSADSEPGAPADDLKLIKGIGPKNEAALNALGVRRFAQIADWSPENAGWVGHSIKFPGRIEREHWIPQAKFLAAGVDTPHSAAVKSGAIKIDDSADAPMSDSEAAALASSLPKQAAAVENEQSYAGARPLGLAGPRGGKADDLKLVKGIGRQNEERLHALGVWHFDQISAWSIENVKWIGSYLAFPGRIDREGWIAQAHALARGEKTDFAKRVEAGEVPSSKNLI